MVILKDNYAINAILRNIMNYSKLKNEMDL